MQASIIPIKPSVPSANHGHGFTKRPIGQGKGETTMLLVKDYQEDSVLKALSKAPSTLQSSLGRIKASNSGHLLGG